MILHQQIEQLRQHITTGEPSAVVPGPAVSPDNRTVHWSWDVSGDGTKHVMDEGTA